LFNVSEHQFDAFVRDKNVFFKWLLKGNKDAAPESTLNKLGASAEEHC
jgi:hypothetical protein